MPAYRFCRSDDVALLTDALNACYVVHFPDQDPLSTGDFMREIRELNAWSSSCMVASVDGDPIAVVTGAKRERETLIHRIGVHPDYLRRGHAQHLLESLSQKLAVLGPPRMLAELPEDLPAVRSLFEAVGYQAEQRFADFTLAKPLAAPAATGAVSPASLDDLLRYQALDPSVSRSWERALETLQNRKDQIRGLAIASDTRVEACVLFRDLPEYGRREIVGLGGGKPKARSESQASGVGDKPQARSEPQASGVGGNLQRGDADGDAWILLEIVLRVACQAGSLAVTIPRISSEEISWDRLESMGFHRQRTYTRYVGIPDSNTQ
jgi:GNAT superfamily N-acetyltransferase